MSLNKEQLNALLAPLAPGRVRQVQGNAHLEAWDVRRWLLRVFGWGGWDFTVQSCDLIAQLDLPQQAANARPRYTVVYRVIGRLTIKDPDGTVLAVFEDGATGDAQNQPSLGDAHDMALKTAMSQCLKRCAMNLGDCYGLGLYDGGKTAAVVGKSLAHPDTDTHVAREDVTGGELSEPSAPVPAERAAPAPAPPPVSATPPGVDTPEALRERVVAAMHISDKSRAMKALIDVQLAASKARLLQAATSTPAGEPTTVAELIATAQKLVTGRGAAPRPKDSAA